MVASHTPTLTQHRRRTACRLALAALLVWGAPSAAEPPEIVTDRPDQTESSVAVPPGYAQLEFGWVLTEDEAGAARLREAEVPGALLRIGVRDGLELRVGWSGHLSQELREGPLHSEEEGFGDASLGAKLELRPEDGLLPEVAVLATVSLPVGEPGQSSERPDPELRLSLSHTVSERLALGYNFGVAWESEPDEAGERHTLSAALYTLALGIGLAERWGAFVELFGEIPASAAAGPAHSLDAGITFLVLTNLQLDLSGGVGLSSAAPDWFVAAGLSVRFPR